MIPLCMRLTPPPAMGKNRRLNVLCRRHPPRALLRNQASRAVSERRRRSAHPSHRLAQPSLLCFRRVHCRRTRLNPTAKLNRRDVRTTERTSPQSPLLAAAPRDPENPIGRRDVRAGLHLIRRLLLPRLFELLVALVDGLLTTHLHPSAASHPLCPPE